MTQRMTLITPEYIRTRALEYDWTAYYLTSEIAPDTLKKLLYYHLAKKKNPVV